MTSLPDWCNIDALSDPNKHQDRISLGLMEEFDDLFYAGDFGLADRCLVYLADNSELLSVQTCVTILATTRAARSDLASRARCLGQFQTRLQKDLNSEEVSELLRHLA